MSEKPISPLRQRMLEDMNMRRFVPDTQREYIRAVKRLTIFLGRSPDTATAEELRAFQLHLTETGAQPPSINATVTALRFFFKVTLDRPETTRHLVFVYEPRKLRRMSVENPLWGAPRIHGKLLKLGFEVAQSSVAKYMVKRRGPPSQVWRTFLRNHAPDIAAMDLFVVPTIGFDLLYAFVIVRLDRRELVWINVTANPTAEWVARQTTEAFPWDEAPRYLVRDRDRIYGSVVTRRLRAMGIRDRPTASASPWQNGFAERLIGSIRRECVDHIIVLGEVHLRRILRSYARYYNDIRTHRSLDKDAPVSRPVQRTGSISSPAILGGLHHHYVRV
jgi:transposase InsO family protein